MADQLYTTDNKGGRWRKSRSGSEQIVVGDMQEGATSSSGENRVIGADTNRTLVDDQPKELEIATKQFVYAHQLWIVPGHDNVPPLLPAF